MVAIRVKHVDGGYSSDEFRTQFISTISPLKVKDREGKTHKLAWESLIDAEIVNQGESPDTLKSAAAGAAVGFLLAGPLGTAVGGLAGRGKAIKDQTESVVAFAFEGPISLLASFPRENINEMRALILSLKHLDRTNNDDEEHPQVSLSTILKTCPGCIEKINLKSSRCKHCGYEFDAQQIRISVDDELLKSLQAMADEKNVFFVGLDFPLNPPDVIEALEEHVNAGEILGFNSDLLLGELGGINELFVAEVKELAAKRIGSDVDSFYGIDNSGPDIEDFLEAWVDLHSRLPHDEECWEPEAYLKSAENNWGLIFTRIPSDPDSIALCLAHLLVNFGFSARGQMKMAEGFFFFLRETPSRLYIGDLEEAKRLCREFSTLGFEVILDKHCLPIYDSELNLVPESESARREFVASLGLDDIGESLVQLAHFDASDIYYEDEEAQERDTEIPNSESEENLVLEESKKTEKVEKAAEKDKPVGFFRRLLRAFFSSSVNLILTGWVFTSTPKTYQEEAALLLFLSVGAATLLRLFKNSKIDLALIALLIVVLILLNPIATYMGWFQ